MVAMCDCYFTLLFFLNRGKKKGPAFYLSLIFVPVLCGFQFAEGMSEKESGRVSKGNSPKTQHWWVPAALPFVTLIV